MDKLQSNGFVNAVFVDSYITAMLWSSTDENDTPLDRNYTASDIAKETLESIKIDCSEFLAQAHEFIGAWTPDQAGHDFWLTRNRHGAGFWDRGLEHGDKLTEIAHGFGEIDPYVGDDGQIYIV
jgi:hypothetical protein